MSESVSFWMDNRNCAGTKVAVIGDQALVLYRDRYHVVKDGAAQTKGGKTLRFSSSSLPSCWKRALKGDVIQPVTDLPGKNSALRNHPPKRERRKVEKTTMPELQQEATPEKSEKTPSQNKRTSRKAGSKQAIQPPIVAHCPYCNVRHDISVEKGKIGKPFFMSCIKCGNDFAVRLVQVIMYKAEVAGFR